MKSIYLKRKKLTVKWSEGNSTKTIDIKGKNFIYDLIKISDIPFTGVNVDTEKINKRVLS